MNDQKEIKALLALAEIDLERLEKEARAKRHYDSVEAVTKYNLPYRVFFKTTFKEDEIPINPFYPFPAVPLSGKWEWHRSFASKDAFMDSITRRTGTFDEQGREYCEIGISEGSEVEQMKNNYEKQFAPWNLDTPEGVKAWEKYFTRFLLPFEKDIKEWNAFDFFGTSCHTEEEADQKRMYYLQLISDCKKHPNKYDLEPHLKKLEDCKLYDVGLFYIKTAPEEQKLQDTDTWFRKIDELIQWKHRNNFH